MDVTDRVATALACSALDPRLAGVLFYDLEPALIFPLAAWLADLVGDDPPILPIGPKRAEETLWERWRPVQVCAEATTGRGPEGLGFRWEPGPLAGYSRPGGIVVVPDLALLGLPAARAAVSLVDADVAHLQRSGVSKTWHPRDRWLAALRRQDADQIAPHLLDRFAVRVDAAELTLPRDGGPVLPAADQDLRWVVGERGALPAVSAQATERVIATVGPRLPGHRRDIALARLARALAARASEPTVLAGHVDRAAELVGLPTLAHPNGTGAQGGPGPGTPGAVGAGGRWPPAARSREAAARPGQVPGAGLAGPGAGDRDNGADGSGHGPASGPAVPGRDSANGKLPVVAGHTPKSLVPEPADLGPLARDLAPGATAWRPDSPYPEDHAATRRDPALLRVGWQRALTGPPRGQPIGTTQRVLNKRDIAVTATLLNAARYQRYRCPRHFQEGHRVHVRKQDLLSYRRVPLPRHLLALLLDHTCRVPDWDWYQPLAPYVGWAYVTRALVGVVEVGARGTSSELRATQFRVRGVLDPRVASALERPPGRATPLAHGLTLAAGMLRHSTQQGGPPISEAILVVVTDGRANVTLAASQATASPAIVGQDAIDDMLKAARAIAGLRRVRSVVIDPGPRPYGHLAARLAVALGAPLVPGAPGHPVVLSPDGQA